MKKLALIALPLALGVVACDQSDTTVEPTATETAMAEPMAAEPVAPMAEDTAAPMTDEMGTETPMAEDTTAATTETTEEGM